MKYFKMLGMGACLAGVVTLAGCPEAIVNSALITVHNDDTDRSIDEIVVQGPGDEDFGENILGDNPLGPQETFEIPVDAPIALFNSDGVQVKVRVDYEDDITHPLEGTTTKTFTNFHAGESADFHVEPGDNDSSEEVE